jgi:hypothetical protein
MSAFTGVAGPQTVSDGNPASFRQDHSGAMCIQPSGGDYQELTYRAQTYTLATAAAGVTVGATEVFSSTGPVQPLIGLANPVGSPFNLVLLAMKLIWAGGTAAANGCVLAGLNVSGYTGAGTNAAVSCKTLVAGGSKALTFAGATAMTGQSVAHSLLDFIGGPTAGALAANAAVQSFIDYKGLFFCPPGGSLILGAAAAGTSPIVAASMQWAEIPV